MFGGALQPMHLILILVIVLIVFGPGKLPEVGASLGRSLSEFKKSISDGNGPAAEPQSANGVCPACQFENSRGNQFCGRCGGKLI